jgi:hypothetical protein
VKQVSITRIFKWATNQAEGLGPPRPLCEVGIEFCALPGVVVSLSELLVALGFATYMPARMVGAVQSMRALCDAQAALATAVADEVRSGTLVIHPRHATLTTNPGVFVDFLTSAWWFAGARAWVVPGCAGGGVGDRRRASTRDGPVRTAVGKHRLPSQE